MIAERLQKKRESLKLTQEQAAEKPDIATTTHTVYRATPQRCIHASQHQIVPLSEHQCSSFRFCE